MRAVRLAALKSVEQVRVIVSQGRWPSPDAGGRCRGQPGWPGTLGRGGNVHVAISACAGSWFAWSDWVSCPFWRPQGLQCDQHAIGAVLERGELLVVQLQVFVHHFVSGPVQALQFCPHLP